MKEYRFKLTNGDEERVIVAGDVVALPYRHWCGGGYAVAVSVEWMLHSGNLPKLPAALRRELAQVVVRALELRQRERHAAEGDALAELEVNRSLFAPEELRRQAEAELARQAEAELARQAEAELARQSSAVFAGRYPLPPGGLPSASHLYDYKTGEQYRPATARELELSEQAAAEDGGRGVIEVDGRAVFAV